jgi:uncharacterized protein (DUF2267 family)
MFEASEEESKKIIEEIAVELGHPGNHKTALRIMTGIFHTIRDILTVEGSLHLIAQLPLQIKGIYVTGWHLGGRKGIRDKSEFIESLLLQNDRTGPHDFGDEAKAIERIRAVFEVLKRHISAGEVNDIINQFPAALKDLWQSKEQVTVVS